MPATEMPMTLAPAVKTAVVDLLYRLGDDSLALGHRNSEWTGQAPLLEEDIAFSSMAQDKIGHAQAYFALLHELGEAEPERLAYRRTPGQMHCCRLAALPRRDWAFSLARHVYFAEADAVFLSALISSRYAPLAALAGKLRGEVKYHQLHGRSMIRHLGRGTPESQSRVQMALDASFADALGIFESTTFDDTLASHEICPRPQDLAKSWLRDLQSVLADAGLTIPSDVTPAYGGRTGRHGPEVTDFLDALQRVSRSDPDAAW